MSIPPSLRTSSDFFREFPRQRSKRKSSTLKETRWRDQSSGAKTFKTTTIITNSRNLTVPTRANNNWKPTPILAITSAATEEPVQLGPTRSTTPTTATATTPVLPPPEQPNTIGLPSTEEAANTDDEMECTVNATQFKEHDEPRGLPMETTKNVLKKNKRQRRKVEREGGRVVSSDF